ncbi:Alpha-1,3-mannosyltransferase CMT1 [Pleurostoma richardsiae]|uniref:Alpha-1,3-mannosyltransferase CMT1 n=1 Tax=Pleurostoma richardsiae TaxID=41990 RepID=A0AA38R683_9PEZI|nr:Alpha-1,3-mannosyltransferase CMT1 [Pleurostoma richardsiae]
MHKRKMLAYGQTAIIFLLLIYIFAISHHGDSSAGGAISQFAGPWLGGGQRAQTEAGWPQDSDSKDDALATPVSPSHVSHATPVPWETNEVNEVNEDKGNEEDNGDGTKSDEEGEKKESKEEKEPPKLSAEDRLSKAQTYIRSIMNPDDDSVSRMYCPPINSSRYSHLKVSRWALQYKYFIALDLRECVDLLPRLLGSIIEAIRFLGPHHTVLSIVEGNSADGTAEVLQILRGELAALGTPFFLQASDLNPKDGDRIGKLAQLRQLAVDPLSNSRNGTARALGLPGHDLNFDDGATALFINDVAICAEDILELLHQRVEQGADMTCAMDWAWDVKGPGDQPAFYDVWVSRGINGDLFFDIPADTGSWDHAWTLFPTDPRTRQRLDAHRPFQAFACWNGAVSFAARPLLDGKVKFRGAAEGECFQGEVELFCKDMWWEGYGRVAVVPSVNLEYVDEKARHIKERKGYAANWTAVELDPANKVPLAIDWAGPPDKVKCMPTFDRQSWVAWNESLPLS